MAPLPVARRSARFSLAPLPGFDVRLSNQTETGVSRSDIAQSEQTSDTQRHILPRGGARNPLSKLNLLIGTRATRHARGDNQGV